MRTRLNITLYVYCLFVLYWWNCKHTRSLGFVYLNSVLQPGSQHVYGRSCDWLNRLKFSAVFRGFFRSYSKCWVVTQIPRFSARFSFSPPPPFTRRLHSFVIMLPSKYKIRKKRYVQLVSSAANSNSPLDFDPSASLSNALSCLQSAATRRTSGPVWEPS
jgi:hypothetical protein